MAELRDNALLLRSIPYSDSSLIAHCLTQHHGRISLMVRGARRAKSPFRAGLMPLHQLQIRWKEPRTGSMGTLLEVQRLEPLLCESKILSGQSLLSTANRLFPDGVGHGYDELYAALNILSKRDEVSGLPAAVWRLLMDAGLVGDFEHCWHCASEISLATNMYWFKAHSLCEKCSAKQGLQLSAGYRKSIINSMDKANIKLSSDYIQTWHSIIDQIIVKTLKAKS
jgi:DNA repair protein RecO